ncbi:MAG: ECF transporter S component [Ruminococcaceae bacterium]|nr:ECF transporter S component [Oscillospiraceae bacterium]
MQKKKRTTLWLCVCATFMAFNVIMCSFYIPVPGGQLYLCDAVICSAAILLDPFSAFLVGGLGAFLGDLLFYPEAMLASLITHGLQALAVSIFTNCICKKKPRLGSLIGVVAGAFIMVTGYTVWRRIVLGSWAASLPVAPFEALQATIGGVLAMLLVWKCGLYQLYERVRSKLSRSEH